MQCIVRRYKWSNMTLLPSAYKAGCSQYLKIFVWIACHVNPRLEQKFMIPGFSYSGRYVVPGRSYSGPYVLLLMVGYVFGWSYTQLLKAAERQAS